MSLFLRVLVCHENGFTFRKKQATTLTCIPCLQQVRLALQKCVALGVQGVQGLHLQGRAHCDLKPQNIRVLLNKHGQVLQCVVCDLGGSIAYDGKPIEH